MPDKTIINVYQDREGYIHIKRSSKNSYASSKWTKEEAKELGKKLAKVLWGGD